MGYGFKKPRLPCGSNQHHWRREKKSGQYAVSNPVGLGTPLPTDFCSTCRVTRELLDAS